jgi:hypothetical protein
MQKKNPSLGIEIGLLVVTILGAAFLYWTHTQQPYSAPQGTVDLLIKAGGSADLGEFQKASTAVYYADFVRHFGEQKYQRVSAIYDHVARLGMPQWQEYSQRALQQANVGYERLRERVNALGKEAFARLSVDERMQLMDDRSKYEAYVLDQGIQALPPEERARIDNVEAFRQGADRYQFAQREGWNYLSEEDRAALGSPAVLSEGLTPEKVAFLDRVGLPLLDARLKKELGEIQRSELSDPDAFKFKYGEPLAKDYLTKTKIPQALRIAPCQFPKEASGGSLLRGDIAGCRVTVQARKQVRQIDVTLRKADFRWLVEGVQPALYEISW